MRLMAKLFGIFLVLAGFSMPSFAAGHNDTQSFGFTGLGYYEMSDFESLYVGFPASNFKTSGAGFQVYYEHGVMDNLTLSVALGYARLLSSNQFDTQVSENFFIGDILASYYFRDASTVVQPYLAGGGGVIVSGRGAAPTLDLGGGVHFKVADNVSLRLQVLYKTAIIHHRGEGSFGVAFHF